MDNRSPKTLGLCRFGTWAALLLLLLSGNGCLRELVTWSQNGQLVYYTEGDSESLKVWDGSRVTSHSLNLGKKLQGIHALCNGRLALLVGDESFALYLATPQATTLTLSLLREDVAPQIASSRGGAIYLMRPAKNSREIWEADSGSCIPLVKLETTVHFLALSPNENRLLLSLDGGLALFELSDGQLTRLKLDVDFEEPPYWPLWLDDDRIFFIRKHHKDLGDLYLSDLRTGSSRRLLANVYPFDPPALDRVRERIIVPAVPGAPNFEDDQSAPRQLLMFDLPLNTSSWLTDAIQGVSCPAYAPDGDRVACLTQAGGKLRLELLDLEQQRKRVLVE